ncbi:MAG: YqgE/AlgH family protein [Gammaproteobacteria bacterium]|nr:YqgE/AlgH family protein [Gammaproteobacteria bacterium]
MEAPSNLTDHFLIAMPNLMDGNFFHSVTYICEHNDNGSLGITINKPSNIVLGEVLHQMDIEPINDAIANQMVYLGGPVLPERGFLLHMPIGHWDSSLQVNDDIAITTSQDILEAIAKGEGPDKVIITLGYAGWGPGQLEYELSENAWLSCPANKDIIFNTPVEKRWNAAASLLGIDLQLLSSDSGHA